MTCRIISYMVAGVLINAFGPFFFCFQLIYSEPLTQVPNSAPSLSDTIEWTPVEQGFSRAQYFLPDTGNFVSPEVFLVKFHPRYFRFHLLSATQVGAKRSDIVTLTKKLGGIAGINTNFFDEKEAPLGLVFENNQEFNRRHHGGNLLTGIFYISNGVPHIIHREKFQNISSELAFQAGPRLIADGKALPIASTDVPNRRSGIAVTKKEEVILYATILRFPGARLSQIQQMLLNTGLEITDALNLDGGGSSQLYLEKNGSAEATLISGGDLIPVALVVTHHAKG